MADQQPSGKERPSFASFWKKSKEIPWARKITFVQNGPGSSSSASDATDNSGGSPEDKAKVRRAQVRKAQIQHRQRKANYVRQLEIDIARIREMIAVTQSETLTLKGENDAMRQQVQLAVNQLVTPAAILAFSKPEQVPAPAPVAVTGAKTADAVNVPPPFTPSFDLNVLDDITLSLALDEATSSPMFQISSSPSSTQFGSSPSNAGSAMGLPDMTPAQVQQAINFILALEHVCWDHFQSSDFEPSTEPTGTESGHTFMATNLALRTAPHGVFDCVTQTKQNLKSKSSEVRACPVAAADSNTAASSPATSTWQGSGLNLQNLYQLACSVNPNDAAELTPVQAFFELAAAFPLELIMRTEVLEALRAELDGVVKCVHYGATMERQAFESVVGRVLEPWLATGQWAEGMT